MDFHLKSFSSSHGRSHHSACYERKIPNFSTYSQYTMVKTIEIQGVHIHMDLPKWRANCEFHTPVFEWHWLPGFHCTSLVRHSFFFKNHEPSSGSYNVYINEKHMASTPSKNIPLAHPWTFLGKGSTPVSPLKPGLWWRTSGLPVGMVRGSGLAFPHTLASFRAVLPSSFYIWQFYIKLWLKKDSAANSGR